MHFAVQEGQSVRAGEQGFQGQKQREQRCEHDDQVQQEWVFTLLRICTCR